MQQLFNKTMWLLALPLALFMAGCSGGDNGAGGGGVASTAIGDLAPVNLGAAGDFVILSKTGITNVPPSVLTGNIGTSPITGAAITGLECAEVTGTISTVDAAGPACRVEDPTGLTTAVLNMEAAYTDAAGRTSPAPITELGAGNISGLTLAPGLYKWGNVVLISTDVTLSGGPNDVWIFQIAGGLTQASGARVLLAGGALPKNIFWQSAGVVALGTTAHMEGIVLAKTGITLATGATVNGRLLAQTAVTLQSNTVSEPDSSGATANATAGARRADTTAPTVRSIVPAAGATAVATNKNIIAKFSEAMDAATITTATFTVTQGATPVPGAVTYAATVASFNPTSNLAAGTIYTAAITTGATDRAGNALAVTKTWSFTTGSGPSAGLAPVNLGAAGTFAILAKSGISTVPTSAVTGDMGVSPIAATAMTGFSLILDSTGTFSTSSQVIGKAYAADYTSPTPANLTTAVSNMEAAYTDAAGRPTPNFTELGAGNISGLTLVPGLYKWGTGVLISTDVVLSGGPTDVWIFQIAGGLTQASGARVLLAGGALSKNIFWQAASGVVLNTTAHMEGIVLSQTGITLATGATVNGRLLAQTAVTLQSSTVTQPAP